VKPAGLRHSLPYCQVGRRAGAAGFCQAWAGPKFCSWQIYGCIIHIEVTEEGKVWLHQDSTDYIVADLLLDKGIPRQDIVLGFHAPIMRADTEFSVG